MSSPVYVIAEMACAHDGRLGYAKRIADAAGVSGADALQLQIWRAAELMVPKHKSFSRLRQLELSPTDWAELVSYTRQRYPHLDLQACVYDRQALDFAKSLGIELIKIHANEIGNEALLRHAAREARRVDLCVGACGLDEIARAIATLEASGSPEIWLLHGLQAFPTPVAEAHLSHLRKLADLFERPVGYQDHTDANDDGGFYLPAAAIGMGASILEKHLTDDRARAGADYQAALEPAEFARFVKMVRALEQARGESVPRPRGDAQRKYRATGMRTLVASAELPAGKTLREEDLLALRSEEEGLEVGELSRVLGRTLRRSLSPYECLRGEDLS